jgi:predicted GH43/DUF377 family glycosyl hydrolase
MYRKQSQTGAHAMKPVQVRVIRRPETLVSDDRRVITRLLDFRNPPRVRRVVRRIMKLPERRVGELLEQVLADFASRHRDVESDLLAHYEEIARHVRRPGEPSRKRRLLIGAYFTMEYAVESAALFNPSIVLHPDQAGLPAGSVRFLLSLRATGEGHVSSIVFRRGVISGLGEITFDPPPRYAYSARPRSDKLYDKDHCRRKLQQMNGQSALGLRLLAELPDQFTLAQLQAALERVRRTPGRPPGFKTLARQMLWLARAHYELRFPEDCQPSETVIFPATDHESRGMEDLRLVRFVEDDGQVRYVGTYTAFDGHRMHPMLLETSDFRTFHVGTLAGRHARNKGMALFPRRVHGAYLMISRHDGENLYLLRSRDLSVWNTGAKLQGPAEPWDLLLIGNCGSPLETRAGWVLLTHGVGPMRRYCIGASLLDREDPSRVIGRLAEPLLVPQADERVGYVPNVVYSCGSMIHQGRLVMPYGMSDSRVAFAVVSVSELLNRLQAGAGRRRSAPGT